MSYLQGVEEQVKIFLYSSGTGAVISVVYDLFWLIRNIFGSNKIFIFFCDLIFSISASIITFLYMLLMNNGRIRLYILLGEALGFIIWYLTFGKIIKRNFNIFKRKIQSTEIKFKGQFSKFKIQKIPAEHFNALKTRLEAKKGS